MLIPLRTIAVLVLVIAVSMTSRDAIARQEVDLELVLAVDISRSMDVEEQRLQRNGYVSALRHPRIIRAIETGLRGRIAFAYMEWAGKDFQSVVIPWRIIANAADANAVANELATRPIAREKRTSISSALLAAASLITNNKIESLRQVIDVSGDGPNNQGLPVKQVSRKVIAKGIVINGLPFVIERPPGPSSFFAVPDIDRYYSECVIGGTNSFVLPVTDKNEFATAILRKLLLEIAGTSFVPHRGSPPVHKAQYTTKQAAYDCLTGEKKWNDFQNE
ncbi:MAG: DUF1194 domain-containing protein [Pseudomonadota bacterium]